MANTMQSSNKRPSPRRFSNASSMKETTGALPTTPQNTGRSVYEILNPYQKVPYQHRDPESYASYLNSLTLYDLQKHAMETGCTVPVDDRSRLISRLMDEFHRYLGKAGLDRANTNSGKVANISGGVDNGNGMTQEQKSSIEAILKRQLRI